MNFQSEDAVTTTATATVTPTTTTTWCARNNEKIFAPTEETILEQMNRVRRERNSNNPAKIERAMKQGQLFVRLAREGRLQELDYAVSHCRPGEILAWFGVCMFKEACLHNRLRTMRFMVDRGFDVNFHAVSEGVHWLLTGRGGEEDTTTGDGNELLPTLDFMVKEAGMSVNIQRKIDFRTPLHLAVERGLFEAVRRLVELGADINAVAKDDVMPLTLALAGDDIDGYNTVSLSTETPIASSSPSCGRVCASTPEGRVLPHVHLHTMLKGSSTHDAGGKEGKKQTSGDKQGVDDVSLVSSRQRTTNRVRIAELLVEKGARHTWRRTPNELVENNHACIVERGDGDNTDIGGNRTLCTFQG